MILQIENSKVLVNLTDLDTILSPTHGLLYFVQEMGCVYSYYNTIKNNAAGVWDKDVNAVIYVKSSVLDVENTDVTSFYPGIIKNPIEEIKLSYEVFEADGNLYFGEIRANMVLDYKMGNITSTDIFQIETLLEPVSLKLKAGDWMTASYVLSLVSPVGAFTEGFKTELLTYINNYITNNY
jgi:hypothetical protein